MLNCKDK